MVDGRNKGLAQSITVRRSQTHDKLPRIGNSPKRCSPNTIRHAVDDGACHGQLSFGMVADEGNRGKRRLAIKARNTVQMFGNGSFDMDVFGMNEPAFVMNAPGVAPRARLHGLVHCTAAEDHRFYQEKR